jgi:hypothetical protein
VASAELRHGSKHTVIPTTTTALWHHHLGLRTYACTAACAALQYGDTLVYRARLSASAAAAVGVDMQQSSMFVQDVGRFVFAYPISSGDVVWTVGVQGGSLLRPELSCGLSCQGCRRPWVYPSAHSLPQSG